jgi:signal transduction histidine kinase
VDDDRGVRVTALLVVVVAGLVLATLAAVRTWRELGRARDELAAVSRRVGLSDELAERARRDAETASAGVFELLSGLVAAEEGARGQLAAELHDTVAQSLMLARSLLADGLPGPADARLLTDAVEDAEEQVRAVMARTRPPALRDGDLARAVADLQTELRERYGLRVEVRWPSAPYPLPAASAVIVYRFFQEALHNVVKHADVDDALLVLEVDASSVQARICDDGPGFDPASVRPDRGRHVGLGLLRERARLAGGSVEVSSRPGAGTTLTLRLPRPVVAVPQQRRGEDALTALDA